MWPALATVAGSGTVAAVFVLGVMWERRRRPPPTSTHHVIVSFGPPPDDAR